MKQRKTIEELQERYGKRKVVLVDENDKELSEAGLIEVHRDPGLKHRAFSLQLYRKNQGKVELLLQQRAIDKPAFPYYWANTCCYNMAPGERYLPRAVTRVDEELGVKIDEKILKIVYRFSYYAPDIEGWCENELDTVMVGECPPSSSTSEGYRDYVKPNPDEVMDYKWIGREELKQDLVDNPDIYAPWFKTILSDERFVKAISE